MNLISDPTIAIVQLGLDQAWARQRLTAHNIANANTPGFAPLRLNFEAQLAAARRVVSEGDGGVAGTLDPATLPAPSVEAQGGPVQLDEEMAQLSANGLSYHTLSKLLRRHFELLSLATTEGKR